MTDSVSGEERRASPQLRSIFIEAYEVLQPFFDPANSWAGQTHEHLAYRALHERFPVLSVEEVHVLVIAAKRVFSTGTRPVAA
ncbi:MAG: hypothetical protein K9K30_05710 [Burkholderiaceae bacterium]|nr:hypothetical protein [Sulfuritalea sp.]MCF8174722.1 hypothetical protein [Burkholderiaceae bacterium]